MNRAWQFLVWITASGLLLVVMLLVWVWIESTIDARRLRKLHEAAEKKKTGGGSHWIENEYPPRARVRERRRATMMSDNLP